MPELDFAFLADSAEAEPGRKFYVLGGGIDVIAGQSLPLVHPTMSLLMRFLVHPSELGRPHHLEVRLINADGGELAKLEGDLEAGATGQPGRPVSVNVVINLANTRFETAGDYSVEVMMNNTHQKSLPLRIQVAGQN
ncbi:MAG: hypothetical protein ABR548_08935 [Actinomycetota bacterium]|nr:hypothetical protein [Actinomycetota bacterium]